MKKYQRNRLATAIALLSMASAGAMAKTESIEEVIVTGVTQDTKKFDATFSINTISAEDMKQLAPMGTADLLGNIPGFFPEGGSAGESHNNVLVRGLPQAGGYRYVPNLLDGLPAFEEPEAPFMNNDVFIKTDLMTQSVEAVKGGPGGILYSNALGAAVNYITRTGGQDFEGGYKLELGDWGHVRNDFWLGGPINDNLTYAMGGFYRVSDGVRDPGYTGNNGGQFRANLLYTSDDNSTELMVQAHVIRDKTIFYQNIPYTIANTRAPGTDGNPFEIDPGDVQSLGVDFSDGTLQAPGTSYYNLYDADGGRRQLDITDGINPEFNIFTAKFGKDFGDGWRLESGLRYTSGFSGFNALFNDPPTETSKLQNDQFNRLQDLTADPSNGIDYSAATQVKAYFADTVTGTDLSSAVEAPSVLAHNIPVWAKVDATSFTGDFRLTNSFELGSTTHDLTFGAYTSIFTYDVSSVFASAWSDINEDARLIDLYAVDAAEQQVGPSITSGGVDQPAIFGLGANSNMKTRALYFLDHVSLLDGRLNLDFGARWQELEVDRVTTNSFDPGNSSNDFTPNDVVVGSTDDTLADNFVNVPDGKPQFASESYDDVGWSFGANYILLENHDTLGDVSIYGSFAESFRLPGFEDYIFGGPATSPTTGETARGDLTESITQLEGGVRFGTDTLDMTVSVFAIDFKAKENLGPLLDDLSATGTGNVACSSIPAPPNCPKVRDTFRRDLTNVGVEIEGSWTPDFAEGLRLQGSIVWQDPEQGQDNAIRSGIVEVDTNNDNINDVRQYEVSSSDARRPRRQAEVMINFRPSYTFAAIPLTIYGQAQYYSDRFATDDNTNVTIYPEYTQFNMGALYSVSDNLDLQLHVNNVNDAESFTEGSPITSGLTFASGDYIGVARPLLGRSVKFSLDYSF